MFDLKVVIIGGGIGGLSVGSFLQKAGYDVHLYEQTSVILPVGAAISLWSNGVKVCNRLGLGKEIISLGGRMDKMVYKDMSGKTLVSMGLEGVYKDVGERAYPVSRGDLQQLLMDNYVKLGGALSLGKVCIGLEKENPDSDDSRTRAVFADGSKSDWCDLLIGADGIKSKVRNYVLQTESVPLVYHYTNWNGLLPMSDELADENEWVMYVGDGKRASLMPVAGKRFYFFMGAPLKENAKCPTYKTEEMREELFEVFKGWPAPVQRLIAALDLQKLNRIPICDIDPLDKMYRGRVVLLGDAAHATTPTLGQGGCQALEDSEVLAQFLTTTNVSVQDCLARYERHRKQRCHEMQLKARDRTAVIYPTTEGMEKTRQWYGELNSADIGPKILKGITKNLHGGPWPTIS